jgi:hypothetical protein
MTREQAQRARTIVDTYFAEPPYPPDVHADTEFLAEDAARLLHELVSGEPAERNRRRFAGILLFAAGLAVSGIIVEVQRRSAATAPCYEDEVRLSTGVCASIDELQRPRDMIEVYATSKPGVAGIRAWDADGREVARYEASMDAPLSVAFDW